MRVAVAADSRSAKSLATLDPTDIHRGVAMSICAGDPLAASGRGDFCAATVNAGIKVVQPVELSRDKTGTAEPASD